VRIGDVKEGDVAQRVEVQQSLRRPLRGLDIARSQAGTRTDRQKLEKIAAAKLHEGDEAVRVRDHRRALGADGRRSGDRDPFPTH
jgi:hypothetical protein